MGIDRVRNLQYGPASGTGKKPIEANPAGSPSFGNMLQAKSMENQGLNFSKHAARRMDERGIAMDCQLMNNLEQAVEGARKKGARDVAVIGSQGVFIVNVPNNMVVTTMSAQDMKDRIFTNIDSAVIM